MRKIILMLAAASMAMGASVVRAGIVITETESVVSGSEPRTNDRTVMIEGNKEKMVTQRNTIITDLDKGSLLMIDPAQKVYTEMPFPPKGTMAQMVGGPSLHSMNFSKTGKSRTVAGYKCEEYSGSGATMMGDMSVLTCVSTKAPGASDFSSFEKSMLGKLKNSPLANSMPANMPDGIPLQQDTTTKINAMKMPNLPPEAAAQLRQQFANRPPVVTKTVVTKVTSQKIAANEFEVPAGFTKRELPPMRMHPGAMGGGGAGAPGSAPSSAESPGATP